MRNKRFVLPIIGVLVGALLLFLASRLFQPVIVNLTQESCSVSSSTAVVKDYVLSGVAALSRNDIWVVGSYYNPPKNPHAFLEHWNGSQWCVHPDPYQITGEETVGIRAVAAVSSNDVWAVGEAGHGLGQTLAEHWDGSQWSVVPTPPVGQSSRLRAVAAVSSNDVWAIGSYEPVNYPTGLPLIEHWDGSKWSLVPIFLPRFAFLNGITAINAHDVWIVGDGFNSTLTAHWNGVVWAVIPSPIPSPGTSSGNPYQLYSVSAVSSNDVWAVGLNHAVSTHRTEQSLIEHWNGSAWSIVTSPDPGKDNDLQSVTALSANDAWAVGNFFTGGRSVNLIEHWNGTAWSIVQPSYHMGNLGLSGVVRPPQTNTLVTVGMNSLLYVKDPDGTSLSNP